jgi:hypothetical protein
MQTFLPYSDFMQSAKVLDKKRCWKQVIEAKQIISILEAEIDQPPQNVSKAIKWANHPAVRMWEGSEDILKIYFNRFLDQCRSIHKINTKMKWYDIPQHTDDPPWWLGNEDFHRAMRARLIEKDETFYLPLFPNDKGFNNGKYLWPDMKTHSFRTI